MNAKPARCTRQDFAAPGQPRLLTLACLAALTLAGHVNAAPYYQSAEEELIAIDAGDHDGLTARNGHEWTTVQSTGFSGVSALQALPNSNTLVRESGESPQADYQIQFQHTGTYYVWVRGRAADNSDDSVHIGLDDEGIVASLFRFDPDFSWSRARTTLPIHQAGLHTINVWMREDGFVFDKMVLTQDPDYTPSGPGPALTLRQSEPTPPPTSGLGPVAQVAGQPVSIDVADFDRQTARADHEWAATSAEGSTGIGALQAMPNVGATADGPAIAPELEYEIDFQHSGTYYLWLRGLGLSGADDSIHVGFDDDAIAGTIHGFGPDFTWSGGDVRVFVPSPGRHTVKLWMREDGFIADKLVLTDDPTFIPNGDGPSFTPRLKPPIHQGEVGSVSIDATDYDRQTPNISHEWTTVSPADDTGNAMLEAVPNDGSRFNTADASPQLDFHVDFQQAGTYYVWGRGIGPSPADDSFHIGLDDSGISGSVHGFEPTLGWHGVTTITIPSPGLHTLHVWMREDGLLLDKILLVPDAEFTPEGEGPSFNSRSSDTGDTPSEGGTDGGTPDNGNPTDSLPVGSPDSATVAENGSVVIDLLSNDNGLADLPIAVSIKDAPSHGTAVLQSDDTLLYTPDPGFVGEDSLIYEITDGDGDQSMSNVRIVVNCVTCATDTTLTLSWRPNSDPVLGYKVLTGPTPEAATTEFTDLHLASGLIDPESPRVSYNASTDFGLRRGDTACFRLRAYNEHGLSAPSEASCIDL